jgi:hypothetical protein
MISSEVASWLVLSTRAVERMARERKIPAVELPDGSLLFDPAELAAWIRTRRTKGGPDAA